MTAATSTPQVGRGTGGNAVLDGRSAARLDLVAYGDSITEGYNAGVESADWVSILRNSFRVGYPVTGVTGGVGYLSAYSEAFTDPTQGGTVALGSYGFGRKSVLFDGAGDSITYSGVTGTAIKVWYPYAVGVGAFTVEIDGPLSPAHGYLADFLTNEYAWCSSVTNCNTIGTSGTFSLQAYATATDWTPTQTVSGLCGWQNVVRMDLLGVGSGAANKLEAAVIQGGTAKTAVTTANWQTTTGWADGAGGWIKADINIGTDAVSFYYSNDPVTTARASVTWTFVETKALSASVTGADSTTSAIIGNAQGATGGAGWLGRIYKAAGLIDGVAAWDLNLATQTTGAWFFMDAIGKRWNSSTLALGGASSSTAKKVVQTDTCGTWLTGYEGPAGILYLNDTSTVISLPDTNSHSVLITYAATGAGLIPEVRFSGMQVINGDSASGTQIINAGHGGYKASDFVFDANFALLVTNQVAALTCPLVTLGFGSNEYGQDILPATYQTYMVAFVDAIRAANANAQILIIAWWEPSSPPETYPWSQYVTCMRNVAALYNQVRVVDFSPTSDWPQPGTAAGIASGYYSDTIHLTATGSAAVAGRIYQTVFGHGQCTSSPGVN